MEARNSPTRWTLTHPFPEISSSSDHCGQLTVTKERGVPPIPPWQSLGKLQAWQSRPYSDRLCDLEQTVPWVFGVGQGDSSSPPDMASSTGPAWQAGLFL